ncbi:MAG TPA: DUF2865 domain-containing protein [Xanthobacteraceae bacterium]|jgi:hypothetical protein|nr:DUF2865 domain-containing protein [Xanthobacteraceae bacterium]
MAIRKRGGRRAWRVTVLGTALCAAVSLAMPGAACAQGFFDFLFGGFQQRPPQQESHPAPPAPGVGRVAPAPLGQESVNESGGSTGHAVGFCVRLCDGQHFPVEQIVNGTPAETCRAICPYSKTKVFFGSEIGAAVAQDGQRYTALDTAFLYRKQLVANCTCNGKDAFGLTSFDVKRDPTLRPGDIVSTHEGLLAFTGRSAQGAAFTPVNPATLPPDIKPGSSPPRAAPPADPAADEEGGTIVQRSNGLLPNTPPPGR